MIASTGSAKVIDEVVTHNKFLKKTLQDYEVISVIGNGSFGTCFKVRDKQTGEIFAWKGMDYDELSEVQKASLVSEINVLRQLQHPNIVQYYHYLVNHEAKSLFIVMECCEGGDLAQLIAKARLERKRFEEKYIWRVLFQICKALQVCHNKIREGTILHRDIKPANIFLDAEGNAKLGDFGLARMLRRNECFAETFVGTPYYMSPEIVRGSKYDRKSDVWAMGCLIYEMCALQPPFKGREFEQLSENIAIGKFSNIPELYSSDLQEIIAFMLKVENEQRPNIEIITRHPLVVRNITDLGNVYPELLKAEEDFYVIANDKAPRCKLQYSQPEMPSTIFSETNSFNTDETVYDQRQLRVSGVFTPDLRAELFYSAKRRIFSKNLMQSDPELYESIRRNEYATVDETAKLKTNEARNSIDCQHTSPTLITQSIFDAALQKRLHAIRAEECLLNEKVAMLNAREQQLNEREKRLQDLERNLHEFEIKLKKRFSQEQQTLISKLVCTETKTAERTRMPLPDEVANPLTIILPKLPPPIPPRSKTVVNPDDTYCSIEPEDSPTMAKLNLATLPAGKAFPTVRKVTFQSPQKVIKYDIENIPPKTAGSSAKSQLLMTSGNNMQTSVSSKGSDDSAESHTTQRRKSILSIFGLHRSTAKDATKTIHSSTQAKTVTKTTTITQQPSKARLTFTPKDEQILSKCETAELTNIWTKENKRAAFDLLAAINAASTERDSELNILRHRAVQHQQYYQQSSQHHASHAMARNKFRQSVKERNTTMQRNRLRRSMIVTPTAQEKSLQIVNASGREQFII